MKNYNEITANTQEELILPDIGYNNAFWMKITDKKVIGFGEVAHICGTIEDVESWIFNEFCKEAIENRTKAFNFKTKTKIKSLENLKKDIDYQINLLKEHANNVQKTGFRKNTTNKKSARSKSLRATKKNKK